MLKAFKDALHELLSLKICCFSERLRCISDLFICSISVRDLQGFVGHLSR